MPINGWAGKMPAFIVEMMSCNLQTNLKFSHLALGCVP